MTSNSSSPQSQIVLPNTTLRSRSNDKYIPKSHVEKLIELRNSKVVELYCVSRLNGLLNIKDENLLNNDINSFLSKNDIRKNIRFQPDTLPTNSQFNESSSTNIIDTNYPKKSLSTGNINKKNAPENEIERLPSIPVSMSSVSINLTNEKLSANDSTDSHSDLINFPKHSDDLPISTPILKRTLPDELNENNEPAIKKNKVNFTNVNNTMESRIKPRDTRSDLKIDHNIISTRNLHNNYYSNLYIPPSKPTPVDIEPNYQNKNVKTLKSTKTKTSDFYDENNINSNEHVYLMVRDFVPSKIPQAIPLAELKYMAQTLPLINLIPKAHKVLTTDIINNALNEARTTVVGSRIEELRRLGLWSLRQPKAFSDPWKNNQTHYSTLLEEAKWMQSDFKEGTKYKIAVSVTLAQAVSDYWTYGKVCCITRKPIVYLPERTETGKEKEQEQDPVAEIKPSTEILLEESVAKDVQNVETVENETEKSETNLKELKSSPQTIDPEVLSTKIKTSTEINLPELPETTLEEYKNVQKPYPFKLYVYLDDLNSTERNLAREFPIYMGIDKENGKSNSKDTHFAPISKSMITMEDDHFYKLIERQVIDKEQSLNQLSKRRGMFYGNRRTHYLRPPAVPSLRYLRNRTPSIWLPEDDQELVKNINTYAYNWELIATQMVKRPTRSYLSNIERRTPWQCFERFVQLNERFTFNDMKGPRAHNAQQWLIEAHKFQQRQNRRISPLGVGEESIQRGHKRLRWASMFEIMRKAIKKRENAPRPSKTQPRKPLDTNNMKIPTPAEMSQLKAQRDEALRRDVQIRRNAKNRTQQKQLLAAQQAQLQRAREVTKPNNGNNNGNGNGNGNGKDTTSGNVPDRTAQNSKPANSIPPVDKNNPEMILILNYTRKLLSQNPELPPGVAWKTAENYMRKMKEQQLQLKQQQQQQQQMSSLPQPSQNNKQSLPQSRTTNDQSSTSPQIQQLRLKQSTTDNSNGNNMNKIKSPTPSEILQRFQK